MLKRKKSSCTGSIVVAHATLSELLAVARRARAVTTRRASTVSNGANVPVDNGSKVGVGSQTPAQQLAQQYLRKKHVPLDDVVPLVPSPKATFPVIYTRNALPSRLVSARTHAVRGGFPARFPVTSDPLPPFQVTYGSPPKDRTRKEAPPKQPPSKEAAEVADSDLASTGDWALPTALPASTSADSAWRKVYIGKFPRDVAPSVLIDMVHFGPLESIRVNPKRASVFLTFLDAPTAAAFVAYARTTKLFLQGRELEIGWANPRPKVPLRSGASRSILVHGLAPGTTRQALRNEFHRFGPIEKVQLIRDKDMACLHFYNIDAATKAVDQLDAPRRVTYGKDRCARRGRPSPQQSADLNRTICLSDISAKTSTKDLCDVIHGGVLQSLRYMPDLRTAIITFVDPAAAFTFYQLAMGQGLVIHHHSLMIAWGENPGPLAPTLALAVKAGATRSVYIEHVEDFEVFSEERLKADFGQFGDIERVELVKEEGAVFVDLTNISDAIKAVDSIKDRPEYANLRVTHGKDRCASLPDAQRSTDAERRAYAVPDLRQNPGCNRTVCLSNLHPETTAVAVSNAIHGGALQSVRYMPDMHSAIITFIDAAAASAFFESSRDRGILLNGRHLDIAWGENPGPLPSTLALAVAAGATRRVRIANLPVDDNLKVFNGNPLRADFGEFGDMDFVKRFWNARTTIFVTFTDIANAIKAIDSIKNRPEYANLNILYATDMSTRDQFSRKLLGASDSVSRDRGLTSVEPLSAHAVLGESQESNRTVRLSNLSAETSTEALSWMINGWALQSVRYMPEKHIALITFLDPAAALTFFQASLSQGIVIHRRRLEITWGDNPGPLPPPLALAVEAGATRDLCISDADLNVLHERRLRDDFGQFGEIGRVIIDENQNRVFVTFTDISSAIDALKSIKNHPDYANLGITHGNLSANARRPIPQRRVRKKKGSLLGDPSLPRPDSTGPLNAIESPWEGPLRVVTSSKDTLLEAFNDLLHRKTTSIEGALETEAADDVKHEQEQEGVVTEVAVDADRAEAEAGDRVMQEQQEGMVTQTEGAVVEAEAADSVEQKQQEGMATEDAVEASEGAVDLSLAQDDVKQAQQRGMASDGAVESELPKAEAVKHDGEPQRDRDVGQGQQEGMATEDAVDAKIEVDAPVANGVGQEGTARDGAVDPLLTKKNGD
ncbi:hypothetical protein C8R46DRAFT_1184292 [Mycena filopes]|nr:hypothetical protein C8R46DRAFT_1184292 [Mycena filopes]